MSLLSSSLQLARASLAAFVDMVEPRLLRVLPSRRWIAVEQADDGLILYRSKGKGIVTLGPADSLTAKARKAMTGKRPGTVELRLKADHLIAARFSVPAAATGFVQQIVEHRLEKLTPWRPEALHYGYAVSPGAKAGSEASVDFLATSRSIADNAMARLSALGLTPSRLGSAAEPIENRLRIDLFRGANDAARRKRRRRIGGAAVAIVLMAASAYAASVVAAASEAGKADATARQLAAARQRAFAGSGQDPVRQRGLALIETKRPETAAFMLIDRLAAALPDTTFLDQMDIEGTRVRLAGTSSDASALIAILESDLGMTGVTFEAPVTRQSDDRDRFDVAATWTAPPVTP